MMYDEWVAPHTKQMYLAWIVVYSIILVFALYKCTTRVERGDGLSQTTQYQVQETNDGVSPAAQNYYLHKAWWAASSSSHSSSSHSSSSHSSRGHHHH